VVYNGVVSRTQVYLGDGELELLDRASRETGASRSELIRRAVRATFGVRESSERLRALEASAGSWSAAGPTGAEYVEARRGDLDRRLSDLGLAPGEHR
jgi:metal-responsive CopG/Arc/MetJ family transcriptional regulator